jgi:transcriptional regulator with XRE-family HTH domain
MTVTTDQRRRHAVRVLGRYRLAENLTYQALADQIGLPYTTVYRLLNGSTPRVHARTLYQVQRFLATQKGRPR